ncbi:hypothetical protein IE81DRAFT_295835 [Ceraceosorus guamensis]|uniref:Chromate transporter n=1 Tax=Ceraceosorus guamensis TaxID=1522189 RepID=A0A316VQT9_9BASI|nr:hypothetical protein IE81DRAFT_295835 [Ceraceosorus guamensis]PWN38763.1 hypothetical protein IE81DRAFT_295835 [Ceraceosorus guamensis]
MDDGQETSQPVNSLSALPQPLALPKLSHRLVETLRRYAPLGFTAFGGPGVHVVILRKLFVEDLKWVDHTLFTDLFALGNALPGPGSTQLAFSIAVVRGGSLCGLLAFLLWSLPGAIGMTALAAGVRNLPDRLPAILLAFLTGLNAAAVGLIALAAWQLAQTAITDLPSRLIVLTSASAGICYHAPWMYPVLIALGGLAGLATDYAPRGIRTARRKWASRRPRRQDSISAPDASTAAQVSGADMELQGTSLHSHSITQTSAIPELRQRQRIHGADRPPALRSESSSVGAGAGTGTGTAQWSGTDTPPLRPILVPSKRLAFSIGSVFACSLIVVLVLRSQLREKGVEGASAPRELDLVANMAVAGSIIFGGGPVVIPLLRGYIVDPGWVTSRDFLFGFAILQAFPGPNFNIAAYLGFLAVPSRPLLGAILAWAAIFAPGIMLKLALLPLYKSWRSLNPVRSLLRGLNAAATGLVFTAVWQLFLVGYIYQPAAEPALQGDPAATSASAPLTSDPWWGVVAAFAFVLTQWCRCPPAFSILLGGAAGLAWHGVRAT